MRDERHDAPASPEPRPDTIRPEDASAAATDLDAARDDAVVGGLNFTKVTFVNQSQRAE